MVVSSFVNPSTTGTARALRSIGAPWRLWLPLVTAAGRQATTRSAGVIQSRIGTVTYQHSFRFAMSHTRNNLFITFPRGQ
jgi:hypothetical protein